MERDPSTGRFSHLPRRRYRPMVVSMFMSVVIVVAGMIAGAGVTWRVVGAQLTQARGSVNYWMRANQAAEVDNAHLLKTSREAEREAARVMGENTALRHTNDSMLERLSQQADRQTRARSSLVKGLVIMRDLQGRDDFDSRRRAARALKDFEQAAAELSGDKLVWTTGSVGNGGR